MKMVVFSLLLLCYTAICEEHIQLLSPGDQSTAVHVEPQHLKNVSAAETWVRDHILAHYPATNITTIVVGSTILCRSEQQHSLGLLLPALTNLHHSLTRWGLHQHIKLAAALSSDCYTSHFLRPESHLASMKSPEMDARRKLSHKANPFPPRPNPALPPLVGTLPPQPEYHAPAPNPIFSPPFLPHIAPMANPPYGPHLPPCEPAHSVGPAPHGTWCVAKPSVPAETLQEALDYACGEGEADCEAIKEDGNCYYPDSLVAHASYAFNSYWQKTKANGGICGFGGTAMIITSDPSYGHCRFALT